MDWTIYRLERQGADRMLFLFHGFGAEQHHLAAYVPLVDPGERYSAVCPRAPYDLAEGDGASWLPQGSMTRGTQGMDAVAFLRDLDAVGTLVAEEAGAAGVALERCVVGGFSQGGFLALALAGRRGGPSFAGVWAMCCRLPQVEGLDLDLPGAAGRRVLFQLGERDPVIPPDHSRDAATALAAAGWDLRLETYDMAHSQTIEMMIDARDWLASLP